MSLGITTEQLMAELERLADQTPDGFTVEDMTNNTGHSKKWCREKLRMLMGAGILRMAGKVRKTRIDGLPYYAPVYVLESK